MSRLPCKDYLKGTCTNSFCKKWHRPECLFLGADMWKSALMRIARLMKQPSKRFFKRTVTKVHWLCLKLHDNRVAYFRIWSRRSLHRFWRKSSDIRKPIRCVIFTRAVVRHVDIRDQNPSLGMICPGDPHQRNPNAPKFEDRSQEETEWPKRCAREAAWRLAKSILKLKEKNKQHSSHLRTIGACLHKILKQRKENLLWTPERRCI